MRNQHRTGRRAVVRGALVAAGWTLGTVALDRSRAGAQGTPAAEPVASPGATPVALPDSPAARQLAWVLAEINADPVELSEQEAEEHFTAEFLQIVPPAQILAVMQEVAATAPVVVEEYGEMENGTSGGAILLLANGDRLQASITVEPVAPYRIAGFLFQPYAPEAAATPEALGSWEEFGARWSAIAPEANFLAAEVVAGECRPVFAVDADRRLALGSTFKLYVLGELARQVAAGSAAWDQNLAIREEWKSLPSGDMRLLPAGTERTLRDFAEQMISVSDNTATDHLLFTLGREAVEGVQAEMGHGDPAVNVPFFSTRELLRLQVGLPGRNDRRLPGGHGRGAATHPGDGDRRHRDRSGQCGGVDDAAADRDDRVVRLRRGSLPGDGQTRRMGRHAGAGAGRRDPRDQPRIAVRSRRPGPTSGTRAGRRRAS